MALKDCHVPRDWYRSAIQTFERLFKQNRQITQYKLKESITKKSEVDKNEYLYLWAAATRRQLIDRQPAISGAHAPEPDYWEQKVD